MSGRPMIGVSYVLYFETHSRDKSRPTGLDLGLPG